MDDDNEPAPPARRKTPVRYSPELALRICERVAAGELIYRLCKEPGMPTPEAISKWAKTKPHFARALGEARRAGGRLPGERGPVFTYCEETADEIFERLCEGESLTSIGRDPTMPSLSTIFYWRRRIEEFDETVQAGKEVQGERFCDIGWEIAESMTPETAYMAHVKLTHLRWMASVMAPRKFRLKPVEPEKRRKPVAFLHRNFKIETDPATGERVVVGYTPNPDGSIERQVLRPYRGG